MAKKEVHTFGKAKAEKLSMIADSWGGMTREGFEFPPNSVGAWIMQATTNISACTYNCDPNDPNDGPTPGTGTARICKRDRITGKITPYRPAGVDISATVYNLASQAIKKNRFFLVFRDLDQTLWVDKIFDECPQDSNCFDIVTDVRFDPYNCTLVVCTRNVCFPDDVVVGQENCGSGGNGSGGA